MLFSFILLTLLTGCDQCGDSIFNRVARGFSKEASQCSTSSTPTPEESVTLEISVTKPVSSRTIWVDDEVSKRTISFTHNGDSLSCSRDGGTSFGSCDSASSLIWLTADYSSQHVIKVETTDGQSETYSFIPSTDYPGVSFVSCDSEEDGTNAEFDQFTSAHLGVANKVICISDAVTISNSAIILDTAMVFTANDITLIAREGQTATFYGNRATGTSDQQSIFTASGISGVRLVGLNIESSSGGSSWMLRANTSSEDIQVIDSVLTNSVSTGAHWFIYVTGSSGNTTPIQIIRSTLTADEAKTAVFVSSGTATISNSIINTKYRGVHVSIGSTANINNTTVTCTSTDASDYPVYIYRGTANINDSTINDGCGNGAVALDDNNFATSTATMEGTLIKRTTNASGNTSAALVALGSNTMNFNSTSNQNRICNESGSSEDFTAVSSGTFGGTWVDASQLNGGVLADCP